MSLGLGGPGQTQHPPDGPLMETWVKRFGDTPYSNQCHRGSPREARRPLGGSLVVEPGRRVGGGCPRGLSSQRPLPCPSGSGGPSAPLPLVLPPPASGPPGVSPGPSRVCAHSSRPVSLPVQGTAGHYRHTAVQAPGPAGSQAGSRGRFWARGCVTPVCGCSVTGPSPPPRLHGVSLCTTVSASGLPSS